MEVCEPRSAIYFGCGQDNVARSTCACAYDELVLAIASRFHRTRYNRLTRKHIHRNHVSSTQSSAQHMPDKDGHGGSRHWCRRDAGDECARKPARRTNEGQLCGESGEARSSSGVAPNFETPVANYRPDF